MPAVKRGEHPRQRPRGCLRAGACVSVRAQRPYRLQIRRAAYLETPALFSFLENNITFGLLNAMSATVFISSDFSGILMMFQFPLSGLLTILGIVLFFHSPSPTELLPCFLHCCGRYHHRSRALRAERRQHSLRWPPSGYTSLILLSCIDLGSVTCCFSRFSTPSTMTFRLPRYLPPNAEPGAAP